MEMEDHEYGMGDLRHFMNGRTAGLFTAISQQQPTAAELIPTTGGRHHQLAAVAAQAQHFEMLSSMRRASGGGEITTMPPGGVQFLHQDQDHHHHNLIPSDSTATAGSGGGDMDQSGGGVFGGCGGGSGGGGGGDGGSGRWPRQETLTLLEIRSSLDFKFKEANQKAPLWDQVSRIMCEEHGFHRSGKKCREKFENLYKYYKKTKEGKAGRQDGKHYRFFRQLEALYGETSNTNPTPSVPETMCQHLAENTTFPNQEVPRQTPRICDDTSPHTHSNSSAFDTSSSDDCSDLNAAMALKRRGKRSWKAKVRDFIDEQMRKLMEKQEIWLEKMTKTIEHKEHDRMLREEEWRKQDAARVEREHEFWAKERAWIEARDKGLMEALNKFTGITGGLAPNYNGDDHYLMKTKDNCSKKRKENNNSMSSSCAYFENNELICNNQEGVYHDPDELGGGGLEFRRSLVTQNDQHINGSTLALNSNVAAGSTMQGGSFRFLMGDQAENLWEDYGLKLSKGHN